MAVSTLVSSKSVPVAADKPAAVAQRRRRDDAQLILICMPAFSARNSSISRHRRGATMSDIRRGVRFFGIARVALRMRMSAPVEGQSSRQFWIQLPRFSPQHHTSTAGRVVCPNPEHIVARNQSGQLAANHPKIRARGPTAETTSNQT